jgi:hypothetical protein
MGRPLTATLIGHPEIDDEAKKNGWTVISMKNDRKRIFAFE